jgi:hypothetical protein
MYSYVERTNDNAMKIHIVSHYGISTWILGKFALKLEEHLSLLGDDVTIGETIDPSAEVNHHITHYDRVTPSSTIQTHMLTHIDDIQKFQWLKREVNNLDMVVCMSKETMVNLTEMGIPCNKLVFVNPAHDGIIKPRTLSIGITCRVQEDGRKREKFIGELAHVLDPAMFSFKIMGDGWDPYVAILRENGFQIEFYNEFIYDTYVKLIPTLDYYLYTGMDEGQMGFVDAVAAGVKTIVTRQGYHLDAENAITYPFTTLHELIEIFKKITDERRKYINSVSTWTWSDYAKKHREIWEYLLERKKNPDCPRPSSNYYDGINTFFMSALPNQKQKISFTALKAGLVKELLRHKYYNWKHRILSSVIARSFLKRMKD